MAEITWKLNNEGVDFQAIADLLNRAFAYPHEPINKPGYQPVKRDPKKPGQSHRTKESVQKVFTASYAVAYAYDGDKPVACGRALSDGLEQAAIYNVAVDPDYQGYELGRGVIQHLLDQVQGCQVILYTHPQTVKFYEKLGWRRQKTAFVIHAGGEVSSFEEKNGFLLPKGYRFKPVDESDYYAVPQEHKHEPSK